MAARSRGLGAAAPAAVVCGLLLVACDWVRGFAPPEGLYGLAGGALALGLLVVVSKVLPGKHRTRGLRVGILIAATAIFVSGLAVWYAPVARELIAEVCSHADCKQGRSRLVVIGQYTEAAAKLVTRRLQEQGIRPSASDLVYSFPARERDVWTPESMAANLGKLQLRYGLLVGSLAWALALTLWRWRRDGALMAADYLLFEIQTAIAKKMLVFPVLLDGRSMPSQGAFPEGLAELNQLNALTLRRQEPSTLEADIRLLRSTVDDLMEKSPARRTVFLSYRRKEADVVRKVRDALAEHHAVFMDETSIPVGNKFMHEIATALDQCGLFVLFIGQDWIEDFAAKRGSE